MKKIILSLVAIIMVSVSSACMASNKGGHHHKGNRTEVIVIHENNRGRGHYIRHVRQTMYGPHIVCRI